MDSVLLSDSLTARTYDPFQSLLLAHCRGLGEEVEGGGRPWEVCLRLGFVDRSGEPGASTRQE